MSFRICRKNSPRNSPWIPTGLGDVKDRIPHCLDNRLTDGGKAVSPTQLPPSAPQKLL
jgi:hypothetical protein